MFCGDAVTAFGGLSEAGGCIVFEGIGRGVAVFAFGHASSKIEGVGDRAAVLGGFYGQAREDIVLVGDDIGTGTGGGCRGFGNEGAAAGGWCSSAALSGDVEITGIEEPSTGVSFAVG